MKEGVEPPIFLVDAEECIERIDSSGQIHIRKDAFKKIGEELYRKNLLMENLRFFINGKNHEHADTLLEEVYRKLLEYIYEQAEGQWDNYGDLSDLRDYITHGEDIRERIENRVSREDIVVFSPRNLVEKTEKTKSQFLFLDLDEWIDSVDPKTGSISFSIEIFERIKNISSELHIPTQNIRFVIDGNHYGDKTYNILRAFYAFAKPNGITCIGNNGELALYSDQNLKQYTEKDFFRSNQEENIFFLRSPFEKALDEIKKWADAKSEEIKVKEIAERIVKSLKLSEKAGTIALENADMISRGIGNVTKEERELIKILTPMYDPDPYNRPSLEAVRIQLARKMLDTKNELLPSVKQKANDTIDKCSQSILARMLKDLNESTFADKYKERRYANSPSIPGISSLYNLAKATGKSLRGRGDREKQLIQIQTAVSLYSKEPNKNALYLYRVLCEVENEIDSKGNLFESGLKQLCQHYKRELKAVYPEIAAQVEKEIEDKNAKNKTGRNKR